MATVLALASWHMGAVLSAQTLSYHTHTIVCITTVLLGSVGTRHTETQRMSRGARLMRMGVHHDEHTTCAPPRQLLNESWWRRKFLDPLTMLHYQLYVMISLIAIMHHCPLLLANRDMWALAWKRALCAVHQCITALHCTANTSGGKQGQGQGCYREGE